MTARTGPTEHQEQAVVIQWATMHTPRYPELDALFAVPNGGKRSPRTGAILKAEGVKRGVPDLWLPVQSLDFVGLVVEMKIKGGRVEPEQQWWLDFLAAQGWLVRVCWSAGEAIDIIEKYLTGRD